MANVVRWDPFDESLDDLFRGFFVRPVRGGQPEAASPRIDVREDDKAYMVHAELPGVNKEDIHVSIEGNQVSISAEVKRQHEDKDGAKTVRSERYYGRVYRAFSLPQDVDQAAASARYDNGVLDLTLPKKTGNGSRKLQIQ